MHTGSSTCSVHRHLKHSHTAVYTRLLDDSLTGYKRYACHCQHTRAKPSGLYRAVLYNDVRAHWTLLGGHLVLLPRSCTPENMPSTNFATRVPSGDAVQQCMGGGSVRAGPKNRGAAPQPPRQGTLLRLTYLTGLRSQCPKAWLQVLHRAVQHPCAVPYDPLTKRFSITTPCALCVLLPCNIRT